MVHSIHKSTRHKSAHTHTHTHTYAHTRARAHTHLDPDHFDNTWSPMHSALYTQCSVQWIVHAVQCRINSTCSKVYSALQFTVRCSTQYVAVNSALQCIVRCSAQWVALQCTVHCSTQCIAVHIALQWTLHCSANCIAHGVQFTCFGQIRAINSTLSFSASRTDRGRSRALNNEHVYWFYPYNPSCIFWSRPLLHDAKSAIKMSENPF